MSLLVYLLLAGSVQIAPTPDASPFAYRKGTIADVSWVYRMVKAGCVDMVGPPHDYEWRWTKIDQECLEIAGKPAGGKHERMAP